ncbi:phytanoyl-CoA dioxygenase family protein [Akkermansiaceae bacterium]|nr:phytanoyl-CoA dioxygenase family protein [Akkermansiaceae bacterium]MDB4538140.1 phytanoyl-CoA dioxygenase family protein [Akkermansiaceae bacterium]
MRLQERKRAFFEQEGYLVVRGFFEVEEISKAKEAQDAFYRGEINEAPDFAWPKPRRSSARSRKHPYVSFFRREIGELIRDGRLGALVREVAGLESVRYWHDQLLFEEIRESGEVSYHWHREESRWRTCEAEKMVTAWIPLMDFTHEMGPITIVPEGRALSQMKRMVLQAGDLVLFSSKTLHGNPPNFGKLARRALAAHFASGEIQYRPHGKFSHVNERLVRRENGVPNFQDERVCPVVA